MRRWGMTLLVIVGIVLLYAAPVVGLMLLLGAAVRVLDEYAHRRERAKDDERFRRAMRRRWDGTR